MLIENIEMEIPVGENSEKKIVGAFVLINYKKFQEEKQ